MRRKRFLKGSVRPRQHGRRKVWVTQGWEDGCRRSKVLGKVPTGTLRRDPTLPPAHFGPGLRRLRRRLHRPFDLVGLARRRRTAGSI